MDVLTDGAVFAGESRDAVTRVALDAVYTGAVDARLTRTVIDS